MRENKKEFFRVENRNQYWFVIQELTARELKRKYARSYLGIVWSVLNPLLMMIVMTVIFSYMFSRSIENYPIYYLTGSLFYELFSTATNHAMSALVDNRTMLLKVKLPKQVFVLSRIYTSVINFLYSCAAYLVVYVIVGIHPSWTVVLILVDVFFSILFATGISYILSISYVFFADIKYLYSVLLRLVLYLSALFYPVDQLPGFLQELLGFNPVYISILFARECLMYGRIPEPWVWVRLILYGTLSFIIGLTFFRRKENQVMIHL